MADAARAQAILVLFPELGLSAYSCDDLFHQRALLNACLGGLDQIVQASKTHPLIAVLGVPLQVDHLHYNCAVVVCGGRILGVIPKTYLPNYREFYEQRYFSPAGTYSRREIELLGFGNVPFGSRLLFQADEQPLLKFHVEICEDLWVPIPHRMPRWLALLSF